MKKIIFSCFMACFILGCNANKQSQLTHDKTQTINFTAINIGSYNITLSSQDEFQTAIFKDNKGREMKLKLAVSGSGTRMVGEDGTQIHFKKGEGVLNLAKSPKDIFLKYK